MSACLLGLRNAYNKLETLTTLHLKWFQMLKQTARRRAHGSPPPLVLKKAVFKKKTIIIVLRHFPKYRDNFSQHHTKVLYQYKTEYFLTTLLKKLFKEKMSILAVPSSNLSILSNIKHNGTSCKKSELFYSY